MAKKKEATKKKAKAKKESGEEVKRFRGVGHPPIFETPEELAVKIGEYFNEGVKIRTVIVGKFPNQKAIEVPVPTITGLCFYLGFESRQSFYDYKKREKFSYTIKRARLFIEQEYEEQLQFGNVTGAIFALKNLGWIDKTIVDNKTQLMFETDPFKKIRENNGIKEEEIPTKDEKLKD